MKTKKTIYLFFALLILSVMTLTAYADSEKSWVEAVSQMNQIFRKLATNSESKQPEVNPCDSGDSFNWDNCYDKILKPKDLTLWRKSLLSGTEYAYRQSVRHKLGQLASILSQHPYFSTVASAYDQFLSLSLEALKNPMDSKISFDKNNAQDMLNHSIAIMTAIFIYHQSVIDAENNNYEARKKIHEREEAVLGVGKEIFRQLEEYLRMVQTGSKAKELKKELLERISTNIAFLPVGGNGFDNLKKSLEKINAAYENLEQLKVAHENDVRELANQLGCGVTKALITVSKHDDLENINSRHLPKIQSAESEITHLTNQYLEEYSHYNSQDNPEGFSATVKEHFNRESDQIQDSYLEANSKIYFDTLSELARLGVDDNTVTKLFLPM